jgi:hypothetical protein
VRGSLESDLTFYISDHKCRLCPDQTDAKTARR